MTFHNKLLLVNKGSNAMKIAFSQYGEHIYISWEKLVIHLYTLSSHTFM